MATDRSAMLPGSNWLWRVLPAAPSTNYPLRPVTKDPYSLLPEKAVVLDVGSAALQGRYAFARDSARLGELRFIHLDLEKVPGVTMVGNGMRLPLKAESVDLVLCVSVLEYIAEPQTLVDEAYRVLKPGGFVYLSAPFIFPSHPDDPSAFCRRDDLFRYSTRGLRALARRFEVITAGSNRGPASTFCHLLIPFLAITFSLNSTRLYAALLYLFTWAFAWLKYLDRWIGRYTMADVLFGSALLLGRKPLGGKGTRDGYALATSR